MFIQKKLKKGIPYYYVIKKARVNGKPRTVWQLYLGTAERLANLLKKPPPSTLKSFSYGKQAALLAISDELNIVNTIDSHAQLQRIHGLTVGEYMLLLIMGRCDKPISKRGMQDWFTNSCMNLLWSFKHSLSSQNFLNHMKRLDRIKDNVEKDLAETLLKKGLTPATLIWDRSNFYTHIEHGESLPQKGHSKHHRNDKNLVDLGLVISEQNIPFMHTVHEANMHDAQSFPIMLDKLVKRLTELHVNTRELVLVFDKGNNSEPNIKKVVENMHVVGSVKPTQVKDIMDVPLSKYATLYTNKKKHVIRGYRVKRTLFGREYTILVTHNEGTEKRQHASYEKNRKAVLEKLADMKRRLAKLQKRRTSSSIEREIHDIVRKDMRAVIKYTLTKKEKGFALEYAINKDAEAEKMKALGKTILFTDMKEWSSKKIAQTYNSKYRVEEDFKWFNNTALLAVKPLFSRLDSSVRVHMFLCVMGMLLYRYLFWKLKDFKLTGERILKELEEIRLAVVKGKKTRVVFEQMSPLQVRLLSELKLDRFMDTS